MGGEGRSRRRRRGRMGRDDNITTPTYDIQFSNFTNTMTLKCVN
jgi:hypothetical protein